ncbi:MAG: DUF481 domain-containing protein [Candidatus Krumholzibacteriota bacterium]
MMRSISGKSLTLALTILGLVLVASTRGASAQTDTWGPPPPSAQERDWIRISSGEWLWGTIDLMRDEELFFDSEELDDVTIDWEDIAEIRSARMMTYVMINGSMVTGTAVFRDDLLKVDTGTGVREFPRARVHSILEGQPNELNFWSARVGLDLRIRTGNTEQDDLNSRVLLKREGARSRIDLKYQGNFSEADGEQTIRNNRGNAEWKWFLSRRFFLSPVKVEYYDDKFQNIDRRITTGVGAGYYLSRNSTADWFVELGAAYQDTRWESVQEGEEDQESNASLPLRTTLETDLTKRIELTAEYGVQIGLGHEANTIHHTYILFEIEIWNDFDFDMSATWDHVDRPKTNADGITPEKDDLAMFYGISLEF